MAEIVNLNKARKARARMAATVRAVENRVRHGRTAGERERDRLDAARAAHATEQARLLPSADLLLESEDGAGHT